MNNLNSSIPNLLVPIGELAVFTTGTTGQFGGTTVSPGRLYSGYTCTALYASADAASVLLKQTDAAGNNLRLYAGPDGGKQGGTTTFHFSGYDIAGWDSGALAYAMCYCNDPCRAPFAISGHTNITNYGETLIGSRPPVTPVANPR